MKALSQGQVTDLVPLVSVRQGHLIEVKGTFLLPPAQGGCDKIYAINIKHSKVNVAYQQNGKSLNDKPILQLDSSRLLFRHIRTIQSGVCDMCGMYLTYHLQPIHAHPQTGSGVRNMFQTVLPSAV